MISAFRGCFRTAGDHSESRRGASFGLRRSWPTRVVFEDTSTVRESGIKQLQVEHRNKAGVKQQRWQAKKEPEAGPSFLF